MLNRKPRIAKKSIALQTCESLLAMVNKGKVRIVKEHTPSGPIYIAYSTSGTHIGIVNDRYKYMFEKVIFERGSGDGLFKGFSQTTAME